MVEEENQMNLEASQTDVQQQAEDKLIELKREKQGQNLTLPSVGVVY